METQRCERPNRFHGVGIVVADDRVLTAGHNVEGELRELNVDGAPAEIVVLDLRTDIAVVAAEVAAGTFTPAPAVPDTATMLLPDGTIDVTIDRSTTLIVEHATDRATYRRDVVFFTPAPVDGDSGAPLVDDDGRVVGIVVAEQAGEGIAVRARELASALEIPGDRDDLTLPDPPGAC